MCKLDDFCHWLTMKKDWCCCIALIVVTVIFTIFFVKMGLLDSFWNLLIYFIDNAVEVVAKEGWANWITAIATSIAACFAYRAYKQSLKARKSAAFSTLFAQLIENYKSIFGNKENTDSSFVSLFNHFKEKIDSKKSESISSDFVEQMYREGLGDDTYFSHCFKYVYYEIKTVLGESFDDDDVKRHYIGIIQACMTYDELFCYFINLLQYFTKDGNSNENPEEFHPKNKDDEKFIDGIRNYDFFKNLTEGHDVTYKNLINHLYGSNDRKIKSVIESIIKPDYFLH